MALELNAFLDVFTVRKLGVYGHEELAMGTSDSSGNRILDHDVVDTQGISAEVVDAVAEREAAELRRIALAYCHTTKPPGVKGRCVILVDDGAATGSTMLAAIKAVKSAFSAYVIVAAPVIPRGTVLKLSEEADEVVTLSSTESFQGVCQSYQNFASTTDEELRELLLLLQTKVFGLT